MNLRQRSCTISNLTKLLRCTVLIVVCFLIWHCDVGAKCEISIRSKSTKLHRNSFLVWNCSSTMSWKVLFICAILKNDDKNINN